MLSEQMERQRPDKKLFVTAATTVPLHKRHIFASASGNAVLNITLPNVSEAKGQKFTVRASSVGSATNDAVKVFYGNTSTSISTTGVDVEFESDGVGWIVTR